MAKVEQKTFAGKRFRLLNRVFSKGVADSIARELRRGGPFSQPVMAKVTKDAKTGTFKIWVRDR